MLTGLLFHSKHQNDDLGEAMLDVASTFDLLQILNDFMRIQRDPKSILDLIFLSGAISAEAKCEVFPGISNPKSVLVNIDVLVDKKKQDKVLSQLFSCR